MQIFMVWNKAYGKLKPGSALPSSQENSGSGETVLRYCCWPALTELRWQIEGRTMVRNYKLNLKSEEIIVL